MKAPIPAVTSLTKNCTPGIVLSPVRYVGKLNTVLSEIDLFLAQLDQWAATRSVSNDFPANVNFPVSSHIRPMPQGSVLIVGAWNFPLNLCLAPLVAALGAGCTALRHAHALIRPDSVVNKAPLFSWNKEPSASATAEAEATDTQEPQKAKATESESHRKRKPSSLAGRGFLSHPSCRRRPYLPPLSI
jgi:hypothetical protein